MFAIGWDGCIGYRFYECMWVPFILGNAGTTFSLIVDVTAGIIGRMRRVLWRDAIHVAGVIPAR